VTGTAEELDRELPSTLVNFVSSHLQLKSSLERAQTEMDVAAKKVQEEARAKKNATRNEPTKSGAPPQAVPKKAVETPKPEPLKPASLFDTSATPDTVRHADEEEEILRAREGDEQEEDELDEVA
jgi:hypothetical protein